MKTMNIIILCLLTLLTSDFLQAARKPCAKLLSQNLIPQTQEESLKTEQIICQTSLLCAPRLCWCSCTIQKKSPASPQAPQDLSTAKNTLANLPLKTPEMTR